MLADAPLRELIEATRGTLAEPLQKLSVSQDIPPELTAALDENIFWFSGFKTHHELVEASRLLKSDDGNFKPFEQFSRDVEAIDSTYNRNYLQAEYNFATASTQMAVKWKEWEKDGDRYDLQYRTAGDDRVREEHAALDGTTLPPSDFPSLMRRFSQRPITSVLSCEYSITGFALKRSVSRPARSMRKP